VKLAWKDKLGYNFEFEVQTELKKAGICRFIKYANPRNVYQWLKKKTKGVDLVLHIGNYRIYVECRFHSHFYHYRTRWFQSSTVQRFAEYPHTKYDITIVCTNMPSVYETPDIKAISGAQGILIYDVNQLVDYINNLLPVTNCLTTNQPTNNQLTITNNNKVYEGTGNRLYFGVSIDDAERLIMEERRKECERIRKLNGG
jgi:hypothetical protein